MKNPALPPLLAMGLGVAAVALAGVARADFWEPTPPTVPFAGSESSAAPAQALVDNLQDSGYKVILNKIGTAALDQCRVISLTPGRPVITPVTAGAGALTWKTPYTTVYVTADCTNASSVH